MARSQASIDRRRAYSRESGRQKTKSRVAYNKQWRAKNKDKVSKYNARSMANGKAKFASGERQRAKKKKCSICKLIKLAKFFYLSNTNPDGLHGWCKECSDRRTVDNWRKRTCGIGPEDCAKLLESQGGCCAICGAKSPGNKKKLFALDHDHKTGRVRGFLCHDCNRLLGYAKDDVAVLASAIRYLEERSTNEDQCEDKVRAASDARRGRRRSNH